jgi:hypothetical protein
MAAGEASVKRLRAEQSSANETQMRVPFEKLVKFMMDKV